MKKIIISKGSISTGGDAANKQNRAMQMVKTQLIKTTQQIAAESDDSKIEGVSVIVPTTAPVKPDRAARQKGRTQIRTLPRTNTINTSRSAMRRTGAHQYSGSGEGTGWLVPAVIGLVVLIALLIFGIAKLSKPEPRQTWIQPTSSAREHCEPEVDRSMKEWMESHGGGSQALKERQSRVRGQAGQKPTFVHDARTGETRDL